MNLRWIHVAVSVALLGASAAGQSPPDTAMQLDVTYTKVGDRELKLDVISPKEGDGPFPAVLVIHGGAWRGGKKDDVRMIQHELAKRGYVAISPQYRLCPADVFPAQVHDVKAAVRWARAHAKEHKIDARRLGAMGFSAGGHLALMLGVTAAADGLEGEGPGADAPSSRVAVVVNFFGPTELDAADIPEGSRALVRDFVGGTPEQKPELTKAASPIRYVTSDDAPILTFQGTKDPLVPHTQAIKLGDAMTAVGLAGRVELLVGQGHGWGKTEIERTLNQTFLFLDQHLKD